MPSQGSNPHLLSPALAGRFFTTSNTWEAWIYVCCAMLRHRVLFDSLQPIDCSLVCQAPLSLGILKVRILEWVAMPSSRGSSQPRDQTQVSRSASGFVYLLSHQGSPRTLEWVGYPFSRESSWPRNQTGVSCIAGRWREAWRYVYVWFIHFALQQKLTQQYKTTILQFFKNKLQNLWPLAMCDFIILFYRTSSCSNLGTYLNYLHP